MNAKPRPSILVFCGARVGSNPRYGEEAHALGNALAARNWRLVFGGGRVGLMGRVADGVLEQGGQVLGIIPEFLMKLEVAHPDIQQTILTQTMHQRKQRMLEECHAVVALPGGFGTFDELFEMLTWRQLGLHRRPVCLLNTEGYFDPLLAFLESAVREELLTPDTRRHLVVFERMNYLLEYLEQNLSLNDDFLEEKA